MTRDQSQGTHGAPTWLGDYRGPDDFPGTGNAPPRDGPDGPDRGHAEADDYPEADGGHAEPDGYPPTSGAEPNDTDPGGTEPAGAEARERVPLPAAGFPLWPSAVGDGGAHTEELPPIRSNGRKKVDRRPAHGRPERPGWAEEAEHPVYPVPGGWTAAGGRTGDRPDATIGSLKSLGGVAVTGRRPMRPPSAPRRPARRQGTGSPAGLVALVLLALVSAFFAWVTAEPLWLAVGHSQAGAVTVTRCVDDRCTGTFTSADGSFTRDAVPVMGDVPDRGVAAPARMTSARGGHAYVDVDATSRAALGVALILLCGLGIARATGVRRLPTRSGRTTTALVSLGGPALLLAVMLAVTW